MSITTTQMYLTQEHSNPWFNHVNSREDNKKKGNGDY